MEAEVIRSPNSIAHEAMALRRALRERGRSLENAWIVMTQAEWRLMCTLYHVRDPFVDARNRKLLGLDVLIKEELPINIVLLTCFIKGTRHAPHN